MTAVHLMHGKPTAALWLIKRQTETCRFWQQLGLRQGGGEKRSKHYAWIRVDPSWRGTKRVPFPTPPPARFQYPLKEARLWFVPKVFFGGGGNRNASLVNASARRTLNSPGFMGKETPSSLCALNFGLEGLAFEGRFAAFHLLRTEFWHTESGSPDT